MTKSVSGREVPAGEGITRSGSPDAAPDRRMKEPALRCRPSAASHEALLEQTKGNQAMEGNTRATVKAGAHVKVVQKQDQSNGKLTEGIVRDILTKSASHPHGIKVRLQGGIVGRVKEIVDD